MQVDKYDRQIRLWGTKGQKRLAEAKVLLLGCTGPGIEALKNLILPGIGQVDIWDDQKIDLSDLASSFFYQQTSVGNYKGQQALKNLLQMNTDVTGRWHNRSISDALNAPEQLKKYHLCIACQFDDDMNNKIAYVCWQNQVPVIFANSFGFLFYVRNQKEHHFVESQPSDDGMYYMRLNDPFQELKQYSLRWNLPQMIKNAPIGQQPKDTEAAKVLNKVPYPIILMQAYESLPKEQRKPVNLKKVLSDWIEKVHIDYRINFKQAQSRYNDLFRKPEDFILDLEIFQHPRVVNASQKSTVFEMFLKGASIYLQRNNRLPQPTRLPDINTSTELYIQLKDAYKKQHAASKYEILKIMSEQFPSVQKFDEDLISFYIQNINGLQITTMKSFFDELKNIDSHNLSDERDTYLAVRIYQQFRTKNKRVPTMADLANLKELAKKFLQSQKLGEIDHRYLEEICRSEGKQLISINSMMGAIIGQQAIKLITGVFCPMMNGYAYNGIQCSGAQICV